MDFLLGLGMQWGSDVFQSEITKFTIAFLIAAKLHSRWVSKEFASLRESIEHLGISLGKRLGDLEDRVGKLEEKD